MWTDEVETTLSFDQIQELLQNGESDTVEFKLRVPPDHIIAKVLSAFANTDGGILFLGVDVNGVVQGLSRPDANQAMTRLGYIFHSMFESVVDTWEYGEQLVHDRIVVHAFVSRALDHARPVLTSRGEVFFRRGTRVLAADAQVPHVLPKANLRVFVAMSFREEEEPALVDYWQAMRRAAAEVSSDIEMRRIDLKEGDFEISAEIMAEIDAADVLIADFTLNSRNVFFELGYARGKGKRVIQTARGTAPLEFDVRNWRTLVYRNATELEQKFAAALSEAAQSIANGG